MTYTSLPSVVEASRAEEGSMVIPGGTLAANSSPWFDRAVVARNTPKWAWTAEDTPLAAESPACAWDLRWSVTGCRGLAFELVGESAPVAMTEPRADAPVTTAIAIAM
jgi:hypothetical protein